MRLSKERVCTCEWCALQGLKSIIWLHHQIPKYVVSEKNRSNEHPRFKVQDDILRVKVELTMTVSSASIHL